VNPNPKTLQIVLQGSVLLQVNAGPLEICRYFLSEENAKNYEAEKVEKLRNIMANFAYESGRALKLNASLIGSDQIGFHEQMEEGYKDLRAQLLKFNVPLLD